MGKNRQIWDHLKENVKSCVGHAGTHGREENFAVREICRFVEMGLVANLLDTRSLGALWAPTSSLGPFGP